MIDTINSLDPLRLPLQGEQLIEASAGTGKTFTIAILYLRFLLGLGGSAAFPCPLGVEDILVVTFTEAATRELRNRIRDNIHNFRIVCLRQHTDDPLYGRLLDEIVNKQQAFQWLLSAEQQMDKAAIFTIHGFCQRMLILNAFEADMLFEQQIIEDESELLYQACADFWRKYCYPLSLDIAKVIHEQWKDPKALLCAVNRYLLQGEVPTTKFPSSEEETLKSRHEKIISRISRLKQKWCESTFDIINIIEKSGIDRRKFNYSNQIKWIKKIDAWAKKETHNYHLPDELKKFSQLFLAERTKPNGIIPEHELFIDIDDLLAGQLTLNDLILTHAIKEIRETISSEKYRHGKLSFNDMLSRLDKALSGEKGEELAVAIRACFPVAIIDEFQDTDPQQYRIFRRIWHQKAKTALLLIGDPKQAIYAFRGADIFAYIKARSEVEAYYTLDTNWRSAPGIVSSINTLFTQINTPFMFRDISFLPAKSADKNSTMRFECQGETQPAMRFWLMGKERCGVRDYQTFMAQHSAAQIRDWLIAGARNEALLWRDNSPKPVKASDITVLVRNRHEAALIRHSLAQLNIPSIYLSNDNSVFNTLEAQDILWLLRAVLSPEQNNTLRCALASSMFGLTALDINFLNYNEAAWDAAVEEFAGYREYWQKSGVMAMLHNFITRHKIAENMLATPGGKRRLTDLMHIIELLHEASLQFQSFPALIRWLEQQIAKPNSNTSNQQMRLESDKHLVQITTIHKSKGLEYPIVWLPFSAYYCTQNQSLFHDLVSFKSILDINHAEESIKLAEVERLAEDLRLLYVALTRAVWHCSLGVAPLLQRYGNKKTDKTGFHYSAIGRLIQKGEATDAAGLRLALEKLCNEHIALHIPDFLDNSRWNSSETISPKLAARKISRIIVDDWRVTSYSGLQQHEQNIKHNLIPKLDINSIEINKIIEQPELTLHQFPRGTSSGIFLHRLFKDLDFTQPVSVDWILKMLQKNGYELRWEPILSEWVTAILKTPLINHKMSLSQLSVKNKQVEMEFYLPVSGMLQSNALDILVRKYDVLSKMCPPLNFRQVSGMLKGFIDLVFCYNGRYYLLDYKSNWLGEDSVAYNTEAITATMCLHRYDLQYQLYTLALHRYLRHRISNYCYKTHFGGVIYFFLRGVYTQDSSAGIFTTRPAEALIESMDQLFSKNT